MYSTFQILVRHCSWCSFVTKYVHVCVSVSSPHTNTHLMHVCNTMLGWSSTMASVLLPVHNPSLQVHASLGVVVAYMVVHEGERINHLQYIFSYSTLTVYTSIAVPSFVKE